MKFQESKQVKGIVFNIQRFTVHDGPGIRTEVFLKGCPLHCKWCSNPESHKLNQEIGFYSDKCIGVDKCGYCIKVCPGENAFVIEDNKVIGINKENCTNCLKCTEECPSNALKLWGKKMTVEDVMKVILADRSYYERSGGGVTISGGEALLQWEFTLEILKACKKEGVHTCVESTLHCESDILDQVLHYVDLVITDMKHMDGEKHKEFTRVGNELTLKNIKKTVQMSKPLVIRIPVIPGHNDSEENIKATAEFIANQLNNQVKQVQFLRFRKLGEEKYKSLSLEYPMANFEPPKRDVFEKNIEHLVEIMKSYGVPAVAGSTQKIE